MLLAYALIVLGIAGVFGSAVVGSALCAFLFCVLAVIGWRELFFITRD